MAKKLKIAIVNSGHLRLVPYGYQLLKELAEVLPIEIHIFNFYWTPDSDHRNSGKSFNDPKTYEILSSDNIMSVEKDQEETMILLRNYFDDYGACPKLDKTEDGHYFSQGQFATYMGQIVGFLLALDKWQTTLKDYDLLIRCRWDIIPDPVIINQIINDNIDLDFDKFITNSLRIREGDMEIGGDIIFGRPKYFIDHFLPFGRSLDRMRQGCKQRYDRFKTDRVVGVFNDTEYEKRLHWFNSHLLWGWIFKDTNYDMVARGMALNIRGSDLPENPKDIKLTTYYPTIYELKTEEKFK